MATTLAYNETGLYEFGIFGGSTWNEISGDEDEANRVAFVGQTFNVTDQQLWRVINDNATDPDYPYLLQSQGSEFFLEAWYDVRQRTVAPATVNRVRLQSQSSLGDSGRWTVKKGSQTNTYQWFNKANGTDYWLDAQFSTNAIFMNNNASFGAGGIWALRQYSMLNTTSSETTNTTDSQTNAPTTAATTAVVSTPTTLSSSSDNSSPSLAAGAIAGIVIAVVAISFAAVIAFILVRRRKSPKAGHSAPYGGPVYTNVANPGAYGYYHEKDTATPVVEIYSPPQMNQKHGYASQELHTSPVTGRTEPHHPPVELQ